METKIIKDDEEFFVFKLNKGEVWLTNLLRRHILGKVSALAINKVTFYENNSYMFDEYLAHRIGMVPIITPKDVKPNEEIFFTLDVQGPGEAVSGDLKSKSKDVKTVYDNMPLIQLREKQSIRLECVAKMGIPKMHQKFQAGLASYDYSNPSSILFTVESYKNYPMAHDIVKNASENIKTKIEYYLSELDKIEV